MLKTGWQTVGSKRYYYITEVGAPEYGWVNYLDHLYYIDQENGKLTGVQEVNGIPYTFDDTAVSRPDGSPTMTAVHSTMMQMPCRQWAGQP